MSQNNLQELNDVLFDTLRKVKDGKMDPKQVNAVVAVSNSIISNTKTVMQACKMAKTEIPSGFFGVEKSPMQITEGPAGQSKYQELDFALAIGYDNVAKAVGDLGNKVFRKRFETWKNNRS
ncbi:MAG TPA: hypothetical protein VFM70_10710 [Salinimicrobium sp.]|nr:hypothetical protein [Salinimicrobium sp.]